MGDRPKGGFTGGGGGGPTLGTSVGNIIGGMGQGGFMGMGQNRRLLEMMLNRLGITPNYGPDSGGNRPGPLVDPQTGDPGRGVNIQAPVNRLFTSSVTRGYNQPGTQAYEEPLDFLRRFQGDDVADRYDVLGRTGFRVRQAMGNPYMGSQGHGFGLAGPEASLRKLLEQRFGGGY